MLSSSESDPFTTAPPPSPPPSRSDAQALIHGFPQERHSFRNVDRVRQRFKNGKVFVQECVTTAGGAGGVSVNGNANGKKRKLGSRNASGSGSVSATESARVSASATRTVMWEKKKDDGLNTETTSRPYLKTAKQMESASVGRTMPSSPTGRGKEKGKLHRRRTFAGYQQKDIPLPHIDLLSKLPRSSSVSPAVFFQKQPLGGKEQESVSKTQQLVLHRLSRNKRRSSGQGTSRRSSLPQSVSRTIPNKILAGPFTTTNTDPISNGISITQLSARSLELLIENGLSLVFKKLEMNHGFASDTVKRAWLRCNGDIEATDGLLLTMRKAAEKAEASFLNEWDESGSFVVVEEEFSDGEEEEEEEEGRRMVKRPRWSEPHISPQSDSIDSRYAPRQLSSDHELLYPQQEEEYTPPVGTKAEMYKRLTDQGRYDEAQKFLIYSMTPRKSGGGSSNSTPKKDNPPSTISKKKLAISRVRDTDTRRKTGSDRMEDITTTITSSRLIETIPTESRNSRRERERDHTEVITAPSVVETVPTRPISSGTNTESRNPSISTHEPRHLDDNDDDDGVNKPSSERIPKKVIHHETTSRASAHKTGLGKGVDRMEDETPMPTTGKPIRSGTNTESRNPSITRQRDDDNGDGMNGVVDSSGGRISKKIVHQHETTLRPSARKTVAGKVADRMEEETTTTTPVLGLPKSADKPIRSATNTESRNHQHDDQTHSPPPPPREKRKTQTTHKATQPQNPSPPTLTAVTNKNSSPSSNSDDGPEWTPSDDEMLVNSKNKSQLDLLSSKYGERNVLKRFVKLVRMKG